MAITAEEADYAENADEALGLQAQLLAAFAHSVRRSSFQATGNSLLLRVIRVIRVIRGNIRRCIQE